MASFNECLTVDGQRIFALMAKGNKVTFTKVVLGDGIKDNSVSEVDIRSVINTVVELNIDSVTMSEDSKVTISTVFQNTQSAPFFMREKGVYATVDGTEEYLVFYANNGTLAEYVDVAKTQLIEKTIQTVIMFSESDNINITLSSNEVVEMVSDLEKRLIAHVENESNPHKVDAEQVGLGNVPNVSTNNQTPTYTVASANAALSSGEKLSVAMGKIAKAISSLISHLSNTDNPHKVTAEQIGAIDTLISMEEVNASTDPEKPVGAGALKELNSNLTSEFINLSTLTFQEALDQLLTFDNIKVGQTKTFVVVTSDCGHQLVKATAWNDDWISGTSSTVYPRALDKGAYMFTRYVKEGASTEIRPFKSGCGLKQYSGQLSTTTASFTCEVGDIIFVSTFWGISSHTGCELLGEQNIAVGSVDTNYVFKATSETVTLISPIQSGQWCYFVVG